MMSSRLCSLTFAEPKSDISLAPGSEGRTALWPPLDELDDFSVVDFSLVGWGGAPIGLGLFGRDLARGEAEGRVAVVLVRGGAERARAGVGVARAGAGVRSETLVRAARGGVGVVPLLGGAERARVAAAGTAREPLDLLEASIR